MKHIPVRGRVSSVARCFSVIFQIATILLLMLPAANAQITANVFRRVFMIKAGKDIGTAFTIDVDGRQYLVTAKHVVASLKGRDSIFLRKGEDWISTTVDVFRCEDPVDIAVLIPPAQLTVTFVLEPTMSGVQFGQDVFFVGFPYGKIFTDGRNVNGFYPLPFVKRGVLSAQTIDNGATSIWLDGHNNPGFSGGPIVFRDLLRNDFVYKVAGIVSGYTPELTPILRPVDIPADEDQSMVESWRIVQLPNGHRVRLEDTEQRVAANSGILRGYSIQHAVDLIRKHPTGPRVTD